MIRVERRRLPNGMRIAVAPIPALRSASVILTVEAGQWFEPIGRPGVARLTAQTFNERSRNVGWFVPEAAD